MSTSPPSPVASFPENSPEKQVYTMVEKFKENIPTANDRYRLAYGILKYLEGDGDAPNVLVKSAKLGIAGTTPEELASKLDEELKNIKK